MELFPLRAMTFNLRFPNPSDEGNLWGDRRALVVEVIRQYAPDVIGLQEAYRLQLMYLARQLPGYAITGRERYGETDEEHTAIFVRADRFMVEACGTYWLSDAPDAPGSRTWKPDDHPRTVTWVRLRHLETAQDVLCLNTHFHLRDEAVQAKSAALAWRRLSKGNLPTVFTGDFNARPGSLPYRMFVGEEPMPGGAHADFRDAWECARERVGPAETVHGFTGAPRARIDWILVRGPVEVRRVETITFNRGGKYPSDHFPVVADLAVHTTGRAGQ